MVDLQCRTQWLQRFSCGDAPLRVRYGNATHVISIQMTEPVRTRVQVRGGKLRPLSADPAVTPSFSPERRVKFCSKGSNLSQIAFHPLRGGQDVPIRGKYARYRAQLAANRGSRGCASPQELRAAALSSGESGSPGNQGGVAQSDLAECCSDRRIADA